MSRHPVDRHLRAVIISTQLSSYQQKQSVSAFDVIRTLNGAGVPFMLVGTYSIGGWMGSPRADRCVEVLVAKRNLSRAVRLLCGLLIQLTPSREPRWIALELPKLKKPRVLVHLPAEPFFRLPFRESVRIICPILYGGVFRIPTAEMALALAYDAMTSEATEMSDRHYNASHFIRIVEQNPELDLNKAASLAKYRSVAASRDLRRRVSGLREGEKFVL